MKIKYINWITGIVVLLQTLASWTVFISPDVATQMAAQMMGKEISGDDALTLPMLLAGAVGTISVLGNALPIPLIKMIHFIDKGGCWKMSSFQKPNPFSSASDVSSV